MSTEIAKDSNYVIPAGNDEKQRLGDQYVFKKSVAGWTSAVPASVDVSRVSNVLDMAAGTCAWILDFASMPQVQERLSILGRTPPRGTTSIQLYACDIDVKFLPGLNVTDPLGIATFQQDVTKPFPKELHGTFDLVHMSHLLLCLTEDGWKATLRNALDILKPGGLLMLEEADPVLYGGAQPIPAAAEIHDLEARLKDSSWVGKANAIYTRTSLENNFIVG
ncbi:hypothetical protein BD309DRAFT_620835 [Dichomitus squalens]|nr:hypothetical protein BD309DRAFT_620835 [Dichomitus squalens]